MDSGYDFVYRWKRDGRTTVFSWAGDADVAPSRVYTLAFTPECEMLLVGGGPGDPGYWLPGGGIEAGETPEEALARELFEEAAATVHDMKRIGVQRVDDSAGAGEYHAFYWCRITLAAEFLPQHEVVERRVVAPQDFLDTLFWGKDDPKAPMLLERALQLESERGCPFCPPAVDVQQVVLQNAECLFLQQPQPVLVGSGLIIPRAHRETVFDLTEAEWAATFSLLNEVKKLLDRQCKPQGYNVGWNCGPVAGQEIFHAHLHVIPRFADEPYAGKGIRYWLKQPENRRGPADRQARDRT